MRPGAAAEARSTRSPTAAVRELLATMPAQPNAPESTCGCAQTKGAYFWPQSAKHLSQGDGGCDRPPSGGTSGRRHLK
eukprot:scaffold18878_cov104-Isochrysis_galbana.AAC.6